MDAYAGLGDSPAGLSPSPGGGLLDKIQTWAQDPRNGQALMAFGANLLSGRQANVGTALNAAMGARQAYDDNAQKKQMQSLQMQDILAQAKLRDAQGKKAMQGMDFQNKFLGKLAGDSPTGGAGGTATQGAPQGGLAGMSLNDIALAAVSGVPGAKELLEIKKQQMQGTAFEQGKTYRFEGGQERQIPKLENGQVASPQGVVSNAPGAVQSTAEMTGATAGATEGAKAGMDVISVPDGRGGMISLPRAVAVRILGGGVPQPQQAIPSPSAMMGERPKGQPVQVGDRIYLDGRDVTNAAQNNGTVQPTVPPTGGPQPQLGRSMSPADTTYANETAKNSVEQYKLIQDAGIKAPSQIAKYKQLGSLLEGVDGNKLSSTGVEVSRVANSLGIKLDPKLANKEAAAAITNELALSLRDPSQGGGMPGAMSDADRQFLLNSVPNLGQSAQGRQKMIDMKVKVNERNAAVAEMARKWQSRFGRIDAPAPDGKDFQSLLQSWSTQNPLFQ